MTSEKLWQALEAELHDVLASGIQIRRIHPESSRDLFLGFKKPDDRRVFLLRVQRTALPLREELPETRGLEILSATLPSDGPAHASLGLILKEERFKDIFTALVDDLSRYIALQENDQSAVTTFINRMQRWQKFLESHAEGLSDEAQRGLYGELHFLREHVLPELGAQGVFSWTGAQRTPQDFQFVNCAVEVKTSIAKQLQTLRITNERQLDDSYLHALFLHHLSLETLRGTGETLVEIITSLRNTLGPDHVTLQKFEEALVDAGYLDTHAHRYSTVGYSIRESNFFRVTEGFPRIVEADLCSGVGDVSYCISVAECKHFSVSAGEVKETIHLANQ